MSKTLYLGTDPKHCKISGEIVHYPIIQIIPYPLTRILDTFQKLETFTHFIFTSKNAVRIFFQHLKTLNLQLSPQKCIYAIGKVTDLHLKENGITSTFIANKETQEGLIEILCTQDLKKAHFFLPRSSLSRPHLLHFLQQNQISHQAVDLYETKPFKREPLPDLAEFDRIIFTSPSTVQAFLQIFGMVPQKELIAIGPITQEAIDRVLARDLLPDNLF